MSTAYAKGANHIGSLDPFAREYRQLLQMAELMGFDTRSLIDSSKKVLALPPRERFTGSAKLYVSAFVDEDQDMEEAKDELEDSMESSFGNSGKDWFLQYIFPQLKELIADLRNQVLEDRISRRTDDRTYFVVAYLFDTAVKAIEELERRHDEILSPRELSQAEREKLISFIIPIFARLVLIGSGEQEEVTDDMLRDILRTYYYMGHADPELEIEGMDDIESNPDVESLNPDTVKGIVIERGAVLAYKHTDITVSRVAEMGNVPIEVVEESLDRLGVEHRYGPDSEEELREGTGLSKS